MDRYEKCPNCGSKSLAEIVEHTCSYCDSLYKYCPRCVVNDEVLLTRGLRQRHTNSWKFKDHI